MSSLPRLSLSDFQKLADLLPEPLLVLDDAHQVVACNQRLRDALRECWQGQLPVPFNELKAIINDLRVSWSGATGTSDDKIQPQAFEPLRTIAVFQVPGDQAGTYQILRTRLNTEPTVAEAADFSAHASFMEGTAGDGERETRAAVGVAAGQLSDLPCIVILSTTDGQLLDWNGELEVRTARNAADLREMNLADVVQPHDLPQLLYHLRDVLEQGTACICAQIQPTDGVPVPYLFSSRRLIAGPELRILTVGIDISSHRDLGQGYRKSDAELLDFAADLNAERTRLIMAQSIAKVGSWETDLLTGKVEWSAEIYRMFGVQRNIFSPTHASFLDYVHPADRTRVDAAFVDSIATKGVHVIDHRIITPQGEIKYVEERWQVFHNNHGRATRAIGTCRDITEQKVAADRLRELNETLEQKVVERTDELRAALARAEEADRLKSRFLATMSHEFRTPLNSILGFSGILLQGLPGPLNDEQQKQLEMVRGSARDLLALVNDILDFSRVESGNLPITIEPFDVTAAIAKVVSSVAPIAAKKRLVLSVDLSPDHVTAEGDKRRFAQILLNLLSNAIKFTESGEIRLQARLVDRVLSKQGVSRRCLELTVTDTGIGIRPEDLAQVFRPFHQVEAGADKYQEGTGLGLAICSRLIELMKGEITVNSQWGHGSSFKVTLPLQRLTGT